MLLVTRVVYVSGLYSGFWAVVKVCHLGSYYNVT